MLKNKDIVTGGAVLALGYLLFTYKSGEPGGGSGGSGSSEKGLTGVAVDELGGLGVSTPNYTINIPGTGGGGSIIFPDYPVAPGIGSLAADDKEKKLFDWPKLPDEFEIVTDIIGSFFKVKGGVIPLDMSGMPVKSERKVKQEAFFGNIGSGIKSFFAVKTPLADLGVGRSGSNIKSKKGRSGRVAAFRKKYNVPSDYSYPVRHRVKA